MATDAVGSFYHLDDVDLAGSRCQGTACFVARHRGAGPWEPADEARVHCLGRCHEAPVTRDVPVGVRPAVVVDAPAAVVLGRVADGGVPSVEEHLRQGGLSALHKAHGGDPDLLIEQVERAGLRGRGGAAFPTGRKWRTARQAWWRNGGAATIVCNADEGDPGAYLDRVLLEEDPYAGLEVSYADAARFGIHDAQPVAITSRHGRAVLPADVTDRVPDGVAFATFHDPASALNHVVGPQTDPDTHTPAYKVTPVALAAAEPHGKPS